jgi:hypothetical protein
MYFLNKFIARLHHNFILLVLLFQMRDDTQLEKKEVFANLVTIYKRYFTRIKKKISIRQRPLSIFVEIY